MFTRYFERFTGKPSGCNGEMICRSSLCSFLEVYPVFLAFVYLIRTYGVMPFASLFNSDVRKNYWLYNSRSWACVCVIIGNWVRVTRFHSHIHTHLEDDQFVIFKKSVVVVLLQPFYLILLKYTYKDYNIVYIYIYIYHSYLVDPASSHMLVSKIKPCMSKYKCYTVKLRMAH